MHVSSAMYITIVFGSLGIKELLDGGDTCQPNLKLFTSGGDAVLSLFTRLFSSPYQSPDRTSSAAECQDDILNLMNWLSQVNQPLMMMLAFILLPQ